jgi:hypothetical protein
VNTCGYNDEDDKCAICGEKIVWSNIVDETNGSFEHDKDGKEIRIDGYIELQVKAMDVCDKCKAVSNIIYHIPKKGIHKK